MAATENPPSNARQLEAQAYRLPALDQDFILGDGRRGLRFQLEYEKAEEALRACGVLSTIVVFGSARIHENGDGEHARWYKAARDFAAIASERGGAKDPDRDARLVERLQSFDHRASPVADVAAIDFRDRREARECAAEERFVGAIDIM